MQEREPIHITVPGSPLDPRSLPQIDGVEIHYAPGLHPDDVEVCGRHPHDRREG